LLGHGLGNQPHPRKLFPLDGIELAAQSGFAGLFPGLDGAVSARTAKKMT
jgi:hypothetical protein